MRLADLNPRFNQSFTSFDPIAGGVGPLQKYQLIFKCPTCEGRSLAIYVTNDLALLGPGVWLANNLPADGFDWINQLTLSPSVNANGIPMHGPHRPACHAHFSIANGELTLC